MKNRTLNILIAFFSVGIFVSLTLIIIFSFIRYEVTFYINGATSIEKEIGKCQMTIFGCYIKLPIATRNNGTVLGYSFDKNDHEATMKIGDRVKISEESDLFVVSYKRNTVSIAKNDVDYLEKDIVSCDMYMMKDGTLKCLFSTK